MNPKQGQSDNDYAWLSAGSPLPLPSQEPSRHENIVVRFLTRYHWLLIVLGILGSFLIFGAGIYAEFQRGRADARYDRQHGISRFEKSMAESTPCGDWLTVSQAAAALSKSERTIRRRCESGKLTVRLDTSDTGKAWLVDPAAVMEAPNAASRCGHTCGRGAAKCGL